MGRFAFGLGATCAAATCAVAAVLLVRRVRSLRKWKRVLGILTEFEDACSTPLVNLRRVMNAMAVEMNAGLASEGGSKLKMLITFVDNLPNGSEKGTYYALDFKGTNFKVLQIQLEGNRSIVLRHGVDRTIPQNLLTGTCEDLFDFIAFSLEQFVESEERSSEHSLGKRRELGFTFSFPVKQTSVSSGILIKWTKGFAIQNMVEGNVAECLQQALNRRGSDMQVSVLVNDTVGTLACGHYHDSDTIAAVILGSGTNACYLERTDAIIKLQDIPTNSGNMVVNMEWGNFWSSHLPRTSYDVSLDSESSNPNDQGFEKMISGMYVGDIVRRVILRMSQEMDIFGPFPSTLSKPFILRLPLMAAMHEDETPDLSQVARILSDVFEIKSTPLKARKLVVKTCDIVTRRAARLAAAGIAGILKKIGRDGGSCDEKKRTVVAVEGELYESYGIFREYLNEAMAEILGQDTAPHVVLNLVQDGSCIGAALLAAASSSGEA